MSGLCLLSSQDEFTLYRIHHGLSYVSLCLRIMVMYLKQRKVQLKLVSNYFDLFPKTKNKGTEYNSHKQKMLRFYLFFTQLYHHT